MAQVANAPVTHDALARRPGVRAEVVLAATAVWVVGRKLNSVAQAQGDEAPHQAFGLPMQASGVIVAAAGFVPTLP